ncbi:hypothetical protein ATY81_25380 [Rhizobium sp. R72]|nr:hypothetical protein ATY81_25380 [Rhizobium sp. R72]OWW00518.1 hypothetical protein ATY80_25380 [Rhizobium sp. R711]
MLEGASLGAPLGLEKSRADAGTMSLAGRSELGNGLIGGFSMGRGLLLWLLGVPLPIVILLVLFMR